jgi:hypothetical protein
VVVIAGGGLAAASREDLCVPLIRAIKVPSGSTSPQQ